MPKASGERKIDTVFVLIIFCIFALSVLMVLMLGATIYKNMTEITRDGQDERLLMSYIWTKVKNTDEAGNVYIGEHSGLAALCLDEEHGGTLYRTVVYHYDGWVYELFCEVGLEFSPESGTKMIKIDDMEFSEREHGLIQITAGSKSLLIYPRSDSNLR